MNIICNNCVGARLYEVTKQQFPNPFMWMIMTTDDFVRLANTFDEINLSDVTFELEHYKKNEFDSVLVTLPEDIKLHYIHYIQDSSKDIPTKERNTDILYNNILDYASEKWFKRIERISEEPTFVYSFNYTSLSDPTYGDTLNKLKDIIAKDLIVLVHKGLELDMTGFSEKTRVVELEPEIMSLNGTPLANAIAPLVFKSPYEAKTNER